jgi:hypothetical protein
MCPEAVVVNHEDVFGVCGRSGELLNLAEEIGGGLGEVVSVSYITVSAEPMSTCGARRTVSSTKVAGDKVNVVNI